MATPVDEARAGRRDIAAFLTRHEGCDSDFEVGRVSGGGLRLACRGCGERASYDVGQPGVLELIEEGQPRGHGRRRVTRAELERWLPAPAALPWWIPNAYIGVVILVGLALVAAGLVARGGDEPIYFGDEGEPTPTVTEPTFTEPTVAEAGIAEPPSPKVEKRDSKKRDDEPALDMVTVLGRFAIGVPPGWLRGLSEGAVVFRSPTQEAELRVFLEPGDTSPHRLSRDAARFLKDEHPGAKVSSPRRFRLGGRPAVRIVANWDGGTERAALTSDSGYTYLLLSRVDEGAPRPVRTGAVAALYSFNVL